MKPSSKRFSFNFIDVILILAILALVGMLIKTVFFPSASTEDQTRSVMLEYQIKVSPLRSEFQGNAGIGDKLRDANSDTELGSIINVVYSDYTVKTANENGEAVDAVHPDHQSMVITLRAEATVKNGFISVGDQQIQMGKMLSFRLPDLVGEGTVISVLTEEINDAKETVV